MVIKESGTYTSHAQKQVDAFPSQSSNNQKSFLYPPSIKANRRFSRNVITWFSIAIISSFSLWNNYS